MQNAQILPFVKNEVAFQKQLIKIGEKLTELRKKKGYTSHESFAYDP